jgi:hypothetical protein
VLIVLDGTIGILPHFTKSPVKLVDKREAMDSMKELRTVVDLGAPRGDELKETPSRISITQAHNS